MGFNIINLENWNRAQRYSHYMADVPCTYNMCVNLDITKLLSNVKKRGFRLFPVCLFGIAHIVNRHLEFRMALDSLGNVGYYDIVNPSYTVFHEKDEAFTDVWTEYNAIFNVFYANYMNDMEQYQGELKSKPVAAGNIFNVSCIPWASFTGFNLNLQNGYDYFPPIFTIGKFFNDGDKVLLPLAIQVHHAICDGFHVARFVNELQKWADDEF